MKEHRKCVECFAYRATREPGQSKFGDCRVGHPVLASGRTGVVWPVVSEDDWCLGFVDPRSEYQKTIDEIDRRLADTTMGNAAFCDLLLEKVAAMKRENERMARPC